MSIEVMPVSGGVDTLAELLERLGNVPLQRVKAHPAPGTATEADVLTAAGDENRLCELIDGVLVEKPMGSFESVTTVVLLEYLRAYLRRNRIGVLTGPDGPLRLAPGLVRLPDISFVSRHRLPGGKLARGMVIQVAPDLAIEVLSPGNTEGEMSRKLRELFAGGTRLAWLIEPELRNVRVYHSPDEYRLLTQNDTLDGEDVLPGFTLSLREFFQEVADSL
jgi:Uma2 family endonuclease